MINRKGIYKIASMIEDLVHGWAMPINAAKEIILSDYNFLSGKDLTAIDTELIARGLTLSDKKGVGKC